MQNCDN